MFVPLIRFELNSSTTVDRLTHLISPFQTATMVSLDLLPVRRFSYPFAFCPFLFTYIGIFEFYVSSNCLDLET